MNGRIALLSGSIGYGKGVLCMQLIRAICLKALQINERINVYANFHIKNGFMPNMKFNFLRTHDDFFKIENIGIHQVIVIDEPDNWGTDARRSMSNENIDFAHKWKQIRKYDADGIIIPQLYSMEDKREKGLASIEYHAIKPTNKEFRYVSIPEEMPFVIPKWYAEQYIYPYYDSEETVSLEQEPIEDNDIAV